MISDIVDSGWRPATTHDAGPPGTAARPGPMRAQADGRTGLIAFLARELHPAAPR